MKNKPVFKLLAMVCVFALLSGCGFSVLAEEPLTPLETVPPQYASDYFLNMHFTSLQDLNNAWGGGGLAVEKVEGSWSRSGGTAYDAEKQALSVQWIEATPDTPVTAPGTYVIEMDWMTSADGVLFGEGNPYILLFNFYDSESSQSSQSSQQSYFVQITDGGGLVLYGKDTGVKVQPNTWYTFRTMISMPDGVLRAEAVERDSQTVLAQESSQLNSIYSIKSLRTNFRRTNIDGVYSQNWKFYKNDTGKVQTLDFIRPSDPTGYCIDVDAAQRNTTWASEATGTAGTWKGAKDDMYDPDNHWVKLGNSQYYQTDIDQPVLETPIGGKTAGLTEGAYVTEMDFMVELSEESTGNIEVVTTSTVQKRSSNPEDPRTPVLVRVAADTGMITLFAGDAGTSVNTNQAVNSDTWYTAKALMDLTNQTLTVEVLERESGAVIARGSSEMPDWLLLTAVMRSYNRAQNTTLYTQNFKFYPNGKADNVPSAVFRDAEGSELSALPSSGPVAVVPTLLKTSAGTMDCVYIAALYKQTEPGEKSLVQAQTRSYSVSGDSPVIWSPNEEISFEIPDDGADYSIKCYVWDSLQGMKPITQTAELD